MTLQENLVRIKFALLIVLGINFAFWSASREIYSKWDGVPPVPSLQGATIMGLGDPELSYRFLALTLQNLGDSGKDISPLKDYNYERLGRWFFLLHMLDPVSDHVPFIASYYFGGTRVPKDVAHVVRYLTLAGQIPLPEKWRWLGQAAFLARHRMNNLDLALDIAYKLAKLPNSQSLPQWARHMPAFVLTSKGDLEASRKMMQDMLLTEKNLHPSEIDFMIGYLINQLGVAQKDVDMLMRLREAPPPGK